MNFREILEVGLCQLNFDDVPFKVKFYKNQKKFFLFIYLF